MCGIGMHITVAFVSLLSLQRQATNERKGKLVVDKVHDWDLLRWVNIGYHEQKYELKLQYIIMQRLCKLMQRRIGNSVGAMGIDEFNF